MGTDREINNLLNEFLQLETDEQRRQFQGKIAHTLSGKTEEEKREFAERDGRFENVPGGDSGPVC